MVIKPIETEYKGYLFRSRLEARWAVFFDSLDLRYQYELEGFSLPHNGNYLPDFWLHHPMEYFAEQGWGFWVEIKAITASDEELEKLIELSKLTKHNALLIQGDPWPNEYQITRISSAHLDNPVISCGYQFVSEDGYINLYNPIGLTSHPAFYGHQHLLSQAFIDARSARFEWGQSP